MQGGVLQLNKVRVDWGYKELEVWQLLAKVKHALWAHQRVLHCAPTDAQVARID